MNGFHSVPGGQAEHPVLSPGSGNVHTWSDETSAAGEVAPSTALTGVVSTIHTLFIFF